MSDYHGDIFLISVGTKARHAVFGDLEAIPKKDAWRRAERTACSRTLVPLNYFTATLDGLREAIGHCEIRNLCAQCEVAVTA